ncbi:MAG: hypothetical protein KJO86_06290, partial [Muriicola sp.]|nr:hypothetical protein [Muriicola sp.]
TLLVSPSHRSSIGFLDTLSLSANIPIQTSDTATVSLINKDSLPQPFEVSLDTVGNRLVIDFPKEPNETYFLAILPEAITDIFGTSNDSLNFRLTTGSYADFGNLRIRLGGEVNYPVLVELTTPQGEVVRSIAAQEDQLYEFNLLNPGKYLVRAIFDTNGNQLWDTGSFKDKLQPERVVYFPQEIEVRANWELEQLFLIE